ncbi:hypothetical protein GA0074692_6877 [Micromonospora pallida]|uniref:Helix-turn-helix domain-containing protein n=1 Tax=Micromonospora pallida TaxID=145854 RepID=A0A1C6TNT9_9ACTN|nr:helix-turn-helix domain-containing protein [Micromonospora pallida]SCL43426.1 hypothetical protein GA0074692_6877 [Micromonospora pallida]
MTRPRPVTQADYDRVKELHAQKLSRNAIAKEMGRSGKTISRIADELGLTFDRERTKVATQAKKDDAAARRAKLQVDALAGAQKLMGQMFLQGQDLQLRWQGERLQRARRRRAAVPGQAGHRQRHSGPRQHRTQAGRVRQATGNESEKSMLTDLREALINARKDAT